MALAVLPSARHSLALLLSNSARSPESKILTLWSTGGMGAVTWGERREALASPRVCAERGDRRSQASQASALQPAHNCTGCLAETGYVLVAFLALFRG